MTTLPTARLKLLALALAALALVAGPSPAQLPEKNPQFDAGNLLNFQSVFGPGLAVPTSAGDGALQFTAHPA
jgi:hypothetical protein